MDETPAALLKAKLFSPLHHDGSFSLLLPNSSVIINVLSDYILEIGTGIFFRRYHL